VLEVEKLGQTTVGKVKTEWLTKGALSPTFPPYSYTNMTRICRLIERG
jgi:hypothetical protein